MPRTRRNCISRLLQALQILTILVLSLITGKCSAQGDLQCSGGVCVPDYQCTNGTIKRYGEGLIDQRFQGNECPIHMVCCILGDAEGTNSVWSENTCDGKCVPASNCDDALDSFDLRFGDNGCAVDEVCCRSVQQLCEGMCMPSEQCSDGIDLRLNTGNCPLHQVCCRKPQTVSNELENTCKGKCVSPSQCSDYNPVRELINLRYVDGSCPANQICCNNVKITTTCDGLCLPRARCEDKAIDLRFEDDRCPNRQICCQKPKSSGTQQDSSTCKGQCLPAEMCRNTVQIIDLRISKGCPANEVCCDTTQLQNCDGTCATVDQCADNSDESAKIDLRLMRSDCPSNKICCKKLISVEKYSSECDGTCVPLRQCPELNIWKSVIDLRLSGNSCPFKQVCCKNPVLTDCDGKCVPQQQCNEDMKGYDLRFSATKCPANYVCCKNVTKPRGDAALCDGVCVFSTSCPEDASNNSINLKITDGFCSDKQICCKTTRTPNLCNGTCLARELCGDKSIDLRFSDSGCSGKAICCKKPNVSVQTATSTTSGYLCDGTCLPINQCSDKESINLRAFVGICPNNQICCKTPKKQSQCNGTCASYDQCLDSPLSNNLRYTDRSCPSNQMCCKNLKIPKSTCNGKCVSADKCSGKALSFDTVDLRFEPALCPIGEVCCQDLEVCDGSCVPKDQCDDKTISEEINLRITKTLCPPNKICCNKTKQQLTRGSCHGSCVAVESCSVDLRLSTGECPLNQACCKVLVQSESCRGICTQPKNCKSKPSTSLDINLRSSGGSCPLNEICCDNFKSTTSEVCDGMCVPYRECPGNNIDLRSPNEKCPPNQVCCKLDSCNGTCVRHQLCEDVNMNLRYMQRKCPMNHVCCQKVKEPSKATCAGQCLLPSQCPKYTTEKLLINLRLISNGCFNGQICCTAQTPFLPPSAEMGLPSVPSTPISPPNLSPALNGSNCTFSSDPSADYVIKADVPWLVSIWSRREIFGMQHRQFECVGTLLKSDLVLTSADCLKELPQEQLFVRIGDFNLKPLDTLSKKREFNVAQITVHPDFDSKTGFANLAVLHLSKNASKSSNVCLPQQTKLDPKTLCFLVGWNKQNLMNEAIPNATPDKHSVPLTTSAKCDEGYICSDENQLKSQCADAFQGSPVICFIGSSRSWVQAGLAFGRNKTCNAFAVPRSFVSIASYEMWIREQITPSFHQIKSVTNPTRTYLPPGP